MHIKLVSLLLQNGTNLPSLVSWRLKDRHMHYVWYLSCLRARTKETTSKYLLDKVTQHNHSTLLRFRKQGNTHKKKPAKLSAELKRNSMLDYVFSNHTLPYSMLLARFKTWRRKQTPRGDSHIKMTGVLVGKFSENTLKGIRITPDGRGFQTLLPLRGTNLKQHNNRHFDHFFFYRMPSPLQDFCNHCHYSSACFAGYTLRGTTIILMVVILDLAP